jgi:tRNA nucleotidyltransferase (CCA-adding enzyme)
MLWRLGKFVVDRRCTFWTCKRLPGLQVCAESSFHSMTFMEKDEGDNDKFKSVGTTMTKLGLTPRERQLCDILLEVVKTNSLSTTMRIAGGWVRDKLLGLSSTDIDIALDNMMGREFATMVNQYLSGHHLPTHHIGIIQTNPEQSKHLETATVHVLDFWIDFVNLRSEIYSQESRIPSKVAFGTPMDDALRRDITINALFYNVNEDCVEDFTGKGLDDLRNGIIRTPLEPLETFMDDPLRVLRVLRFASRFNYKIDTEVWKAIHHPEVLRSLKEKISRERIGMEVAKMLQGLHPLLSVTLMVEADVFDVVFLRPTTTRSNYESTTPISTSVSEDALRLVRIVDDVLHAREKYRLGKTSWTLAHHDRRLIYLAALLAPLRNSTILSAKNKVVEEPVIIIKESLKLAAKDAQTVQHILAGVDMIREVIHRPSSLEEISRKDLGCFVRQLGPTWISSLAIAFAVEKSHDEDSPYLSRYGELRDIIQELGLVHAYEVTPLLDGNDIKEVLNIENGPLIGYYHERVIEWQFEFPQCTKEDCIRWLKQQWDQPKREHPLSPSMARKKSKAGLTP